jgi:two-component system cell cycle response regulator DivK
MVVEKNDVNRQMLSDYLIFFGFQVLGLARGSGFLQRLAEFQPDLILFDFMLPDIDGFTLLGQLQQSSEWRHIPVIIISAVGFRSEQKRAQRLVGINYYLIKPVNLTDIIQAIQKELGMGASPLNIDK